jgi:hypothetical protein
MLDGGKYKNRQTRRFAGLASSRSLGGSQLRKDMDLRRFTSICSLKRIGRLKLGVYVVFSLVFGLTFPFAQWVFRNPLELRMFIPELPLYAFIAFVLLVVLDNFSHRTTITLPACPVTEQAGSKQAPRSTSPDESKQHLVSRCLSWLKRALTSDRRLFLLIFAVIASVYFMNFLMYYPGIGSTDSDTTINQALGYTSYTSWIPPFYTFAVSLILRGAMLFTDLEGAIALYSSIQILASAAVLSCFLCWLKRKGIPSWLFAVCLLFFVLNPIIARTVITMWKDIPFSLSVLLLIMLLFDVAQSRGTILQDRRTLIKLFVICFLILFLRKNGAIIIGGTAIFLFAWLKPKRKKLPAIGLLLLLIGSSVVQGPGFAAMGIASDHFIETVALPMQQVGNLVYTDKPLSEEQMALMNDIISEETLKETYSYRSPDTMKYSGGRFDYNYLDSHKMEFMRLWLELAPSYPKEYLQAWGSLSYGYWYVGDSRWIVSGSQFERQEIRNLLFERTGFAWAEVGRDTQYEDIRNYLPLYPLFNLGCLTWITLAITLLCFNRQSRWKIICLLPALLLLFTMMFSAPVVEFRYVFAIHLSLPLMALLPFLRRQPENAPALET